MCVDEMIVELAELSNEQSLVEVTGLYIIGRRMAVMLLVRVVACVNDERDRAL